jgi:tRNA(Arg) A34 adenosine deaminase TadA
MVDTYSPGKRQLLLLMGTVAMSVTMLRSPRAYAGTDKAAAIDQPESQSDESFIRRAFEMQQQAISIGDQAYGAIVVCDGIIVGQSASHVIVNHDPTAHAEMEAIRDAARRLGSRDLSGCTLYSSSRACPMCEAAAYWAEIDRMVYGESVKDDGRPSLC